MQKFEHIHFDEIDSTAVWVKDHYREFNPDLVTCVSASTQTAGRGRFGRKWVSKRGNLHLTLFYCLDKGNPLIPNLTQLMALSVCSLYPAMIKWPNDLMVKRKKLAGILVELVNCREKQGVIHSIGMNVNAPVITDQETISLLEWMGKERDLATVQEELIGAFFKELEKGFSAEAYNAKLAYKGELITCQVGREKVEGKLLGVDAQGHLELEGETILKINSGDLLPYRE